MEQVKVASSSFNLQLSPNVTNSQAWRALVSSTQRLKKVSQTARVKVRCLNKFTWLLTGKQVKILVRDESTVPAEFKDKVEIVKGDVLNQEDVDKTVDGTDAVIIVLGTRNSTAPTTMMSEGTKNIIKSMKSKGLTKFSACMSSFLFMQPETVPKVFTEINADHRRMLEVIKESDLDYRAVLPPHIASK